MTKKRRKMGAYEIASEAASVDQPILLQACMHMAMCMHLIT